MNEVERSWTLGKEHLLDPVKLGQLTAFSQIIESISTKYKAFAEQIECRESDIFLVIPCLLLLHSLDEEGVSCKSICKRFFPLMFKENEDSQRKYTELKTEYLKWKQAFKAISNKSMLYEVERIVLVDNDE